MNHVSSSMSSNRVSKIQVYPKEVSSSFPKGDDNEIEKILWRNFKIFLFRITCITEPESCCDSRKHWGATEGIEVLLRNTEAATDVTEVLLRNNEFASRDTELLLVGTEDLFIDTINIKKILTLFFISL